MQSKTVQPASSRKRVRMASRVLRTLLVTAALTRIFVRPRVIGRKNLDQPGAFIVASGHRSSFDPIPLFALIVKYRADVSFLAMAELFKNRILGRILRWFGVIPVYRNSERASEATDQGILFLLAGRVIAIFIGGGITRADQREEAKGGTTYMAFATGAPVVPVAVVRTERVKRPGSKPWQWGWRKKYVIAIGEPIPVPDGASTDSTEAAKKMRTEFTARIMEAIEQLEQDALRRL